MRTSLGYIIHNTEPGEDISLDGEGDGLTFRKEVIYEGNFVKKVDNNEQRFTVDEPLIDHWERTGNEMLADGIKIPVPLKHTTDPEANRGRVIGFEKGINKKGLKSLFSIFQFRDKEAAKLAASTDVSIFVPDKPVYSSKGKKYTYPVRHICLTDYPVIQGLENFQSIAASYDGPLELAYKRVFNKPRVQVQINPNILHKSTLDYAKLKLGPIAQAIHRSGAGAATMAKILAKKVPTIKLAGALKATGKHLVKHGGSYTTHLIGGSIGAGTVKKITDKVAPDNHKVQFAGEIGGHLAGAAAAHRVIHGGDPLAQHKVVQGAMRAIRPVAALAARHPVGAAAVVGGIAIGGAITRRRRALAASLELGEHDNIKARDNSGRFASTGQSARSQKKLRGTVRSDNQASKTLFRDNSSGELIHPTFENTLKNVKTHFHEIIGTSADNRGKGALHAVQHAAIGAASVGVAGEATRRLAQHTARLGSRVIASVKTASKERPLRTPQILKAASNVAFHSKELKQAIDSGRHAVEIRKLLAKAKSTEKIATATALKHKQRIKTIIGAARHIAKAIPKPKKLLAIATLAGTAAVASRAAVSHFREARESLQKK